MFKELKEQNLRDEYAKKFALYLFRLHWKWISETDERKEDWPILYNLEKRFGMVSNSCFLCDYCSAYRKGCCLVDWNDNESGIIDCCEDKSPYDMWKRANGRKLRIFFAKQIYKLPEIN